MVQKSRTITVALMKARVGGVLQEMLSRGVYNVAVTEFIDNTLKERGGTPGAG